MDCRVSGGDTIVFLHFGLLGKESHSLSESQMDKKHRRSFLFQFPLSRTSTGNEDLNRTATLEDLDDKWGEREWTADAEMATI